MPWGVAAAAVGSVASAAIGSSKSGGSSSTGSNQAPAWQQAHQVTGVDQAQDIYARAQSVPMPTQFVAPQNGFQSTADSALYGNGMQATNVYAPWSTFGQNSAGYLPNYLNNATALEANGIGAQSPSTQVLSNYAQTGSLPGQRSVDPSLASSITQAGQSGIGSLGQGATLANQAGQMALNPNGTVGAAAAGASALSSNPGLDAAIDAANRDVNRGLTENTLPQIRAAAMASGNANSSREGALEAIATRGASDQMADTAAQMRLGAYTQGANLGASGYNQGINSAISAGSTLNSNGGLAGNLLTNEQAQQNQAQQFGISSQLGAANNAASQGLGYQVANTQAQLAANGQLNAGLQTGLMATDHSQQGIYSGLNAAYQAGTQDQAGTQAAINDNLQNYQMQTQGQSNLLDRYWKIVGSGLGSSSSSTTTPNNGGLGGALQGAVGGGMAGYGLYKNLAGTFGGSSAYNPASFGFTDGSAASNGGTQTAGATELQNLGFYNPLS